MKRFYLSGQRTFGNRGCEAIVRSTVALLRERFEGCEVLVPSDDIERDRRQWPEAAQSGVQFVEAYRPFHSRLWARVQKAPVGFIKRAGWPFPFPAWFKAQIASVDAVIAVGGDNYSLDYLLPSLYMGIDRLAMDMGKPVCLWGASVGPFEREPAFVPAIRDHLSRMTWIGVRESLSYRYLTETLGLGNVGMMADPAFTLAKAPTESAAFWPQAGEMGVIGFNISPLIERYKSEEQNLREEAIGFIRAAVAKGFAILLVPHVIPKEGDPKNNDSMYMARMLEDVQDLGDRVTLMPSLNAAQIKDVVSRLRFFIGARTHATIAALSSGVPTISISYSVKAIGINRDLFGDRPVVLETPLLTTESLLGKLDYLLDKETEIRDRLRTVLPEWRGKVEDAMLSIAGRQ